MASIFTGLAFMHGHIVNKELVLALGAPEPTSGKAKPRRSALARDNAGDPGKGQEHRAQARSYNGGCGEAACCV